MLGGLPPVVHEGDDLWVKGPGSAQLEVGGDLLQSGGAHHHCVAPRPVQGRVVVDPAEGSLRDSDGRIRVVLDQQLWPTK